MKLEVEELIVRQGDYTVRLLNKGAQKPERVIFGLLLFDGNACAWLIRFMTRKKVVIFSDSRKTFEEAKPLHNLYFPFSFEGEGDTGGEVDKSDKIWH